MATRIRTSLISLTLAGTLAGGVAYAHTSQAADRPTPAEISAKQKADRDRCAHPPLVEAVAKGTAQVTAAESAHTAAVTAAAAANTAAVAANATANTLETTAAQQSAALDAAVAAVARSRNTVAARRATLAAAIGHHYKKATIAWRRAQLDTALANLSAKRADAANARQVANAATAAAATARAKATSAQARAATLAAKAATKAADLTTARARLGDAQRAYAAAPVVLTTANLNWGTGRKLDHPALDHLCAIGTDYLMVQEAKNITLGDLLMPVLNDNQDTSDLGKAGSALAWRVATPYEPAGRTGPITGRGMRKAFEPSAFGLEMSGRYFSWVDTTLDGQPTRIIPCHYAPDWGAASWATMTRNLKRLIADRPAGSEWVVGSDFNQPVAKVAGELGGQPYGYHIVGFVVSHGLKVTDTRVDNYGKRIEQTDHPAIRIEIQDR